MHETNKYEMTDQRMADLFSNGIFVFDTSALLNIYSYSEKMKKVLFGKIFKKLEDNLWMPHQTSYEFNNNRRTVIKKPIRLYKNLISQQEGKNEGGHFDNIEKLIDSVEQQTISKIRNTLNTIKEKTKKDTKHPHLKQNSLIKFEKDINDFSKQVVLFKKKYTELGIIVQKEIDLKSIRIEKLLDEDIVTKNINQYFTIGEEFDFETKLKIVKEGSLRYQDQIPPGYLDQKEKIGLAIYGDLIIWKETLSFAKSQNKSIILVTNDSKEDWWTYRKKDKTKIPRHELIQEFSTKVDKDFWMLSSEDFLYQASKHLVIKLDDKLINELKDINEEKSKAKSLQDEERRLNELKWLKILREAVESGEDIMPNHTYYFKGEALGTWLSNLFQDNKLGKKLYLLKEVELTGFDNSQRSKDPETVARRFIRKLLNDPNPNKMTYQTSFNRSIIVKKDVLQPKTKKEITDLWKLRFDEERKWVKKSHIKDRTDEWKMFRYDKEWNPKEKWSTNEDHMGQLYHWVRNRKKRPEFFKLIIHHFNKTELDELREENFPVDEIR